jgi:hypothetical protein
VPAAAAARAAVSPNFPANSKKRRRSRISVPARLERCA